jgi:hypothetical protein
LPHKQLNMKYKHLIPLVLTCTLILSGCGHQTQSDSKKNTEGKSVAESQEEEQKQEVTPEDSLAFSKKIVALANGDTTGLWPIKNQPYPAKGSILPYKRIVAYYGNLYSKRMGILGEYPPKEMLRRLQVEVDAWEKADPSTPVQPAIHYIAAVSQGIPMKDGKYCKRMPKVQIDSAIAIAKMGNAIVFLDVQVALSSLKDEVPRLEKYLKMPQVHLGIDPEFSMKDGSIPGHKIGTVNADDINYCTEYLAKLVKEYNLPPKILVVHRFTQGMVRNYKGIVLRPSIQIVMNMDGWGEPILKRSTYKLYIRKEPVQFTGFKIFYKNDLKKAPHQLLTPSDLLKLKPQPIYIQYQ